MGKWIGIGVAIVAIIAVAFIVCSYIFPDFRVATRDIAIVILAVFQIIAVLLTIVLLLAVLYAVRTVNKLVRNVITPKVEALNVKVDQLIDSTQSITNNVKDTSTTVITTTAYVAEQVVAPVIRVSGLLAGVRAAAQFLARRSVPSDVDDV